MLQKGSYLTILDKNGILLAGIFHLFRGFYKKNAKFGSFVKISAKQVLGSYLVLKKSKFKSIIILTKFFQNKKDGSYLKFKSNSAVVLKRRLTPLGKELQGLCNYNIFRRRFMYSFIFIL